MFHEAESWHEHAPRPAPIFHPIVLSKGSNRTPQRRELLELKLDKNNAISSMIGCDPGKSEDGRLRFCRSAREEVYRHLVAGIRRERPNLEIRLCLEEQAMFPALDLQDGIGRCNCVLR